MLKFIWHARTEAYHLFKTSSLEVEMFRRRLLNGRLKFDYRRSFFFTFLMTSSILRILTSVESQRHVFADFLFVFCILLISRR